MNNNHKGDAAFTIVELLVVIVVIAVLAAIVTVAYNGVTSRASDSVAKTTAENAIKKLETTMISTNTYPLKIEQTGIAAPGDTRVEYTSDGASYCMTSSSIRAKTDYYQTNSSGNYVAGKCPNHLGYQGSAGTFSTSSIFGSNPPETNSYSIYSDGGGDLWVGDRFYTLRDNGVRVVGVRVWEPPTASSAFLSTPLTARLYTQDWQGVSLGGWNSLPAPAQTATFSGTRKAGTWTYMYFSGSTAIVKASAAVGPADMATAAVRYDGNSYVAANPALHPFPVESSQLSSVYLSEDSNLGRSVSNVYPGGAGAYYYGIDILVTAL